MLREIDVDLLQLSALRPSTRLPRVTLHDIARARASGVRPLVVRPLANTLPLRYEIIEGGKSWVVAQRAGLATVAAEVRADLTDDEVRKRLEEEGRQARDPIVESQVIDAMLADEPGLKITALAQREGLPRPTVSHRRRLGRLAPAVQALLSDGQLKEGHARPLVTLPAAEQLRFAKRIVREHLTCRAVEQLVREYHGRAATQPALSQRPAPSSVSPAKDPDQVRAEQMISDHLACRTEFSDAGGKLTVVFHHHDAEVRDGILEKLGAGGM
ncbi:MAG: ParB/RepB/Spo0J family partition protein [Acidiferrobacterales bacterium]